MMNFQEKNLLSLEEINRRREMFLLPVDDNGRLYVAVSRKIIEEISSRYNRSKMGGASQ